MYSLNKQQIDELVEIWQQTAYSLCYFQAKHWNEFSHEQHLDVNAYQNSLLNRANDLEAKVFNPSFSQSDRILEIVRKATKEGLTVVERTPDLSVSLSIGAILVALAAYVSRADQGGIQIAMRELQNILEQLQKFE